jgi:hypothetical protein
MSADPRLEALTRDRWDEHLRSLGAATALIIALLHVLAEYWPEDGTVVDAILVAPEPIRRVAESLLDQLQFSPYRPVEAD